MKNNYEKNDLPIGVFDSGVGGLTVLQALQQRLPNESFLYLGDTARLPYGTKSPDTVIRYAKQACQILIDSGVKCLIIACNTASTLAINTLREAFPNIPLIGVVEPGAIAACATSKSGNIAVIATEATIKAKGYNNAIKKIRPNANVISQSCRLFVALAEEGLSDDPISDAVAKKYLQPLLQYKNGEAIDCLVLGCTHYPVLTPSIKRIVGDDIQIVDSAQTTVDRVEAVLRENNLMTTKKTNATTTFFVTDGPEHFVQVANRFLKIDIDLKFIEHVDITINQ